MERQKERQEVGVGLALNYAAYAKCKLSWRVIRETRGVVHISVKISNDTLRRLRPYRVAKA